MHSESFCLLCRLGAGKEGGVWCVRTRNRLRVAPVMYCILQLSRLSRFVGVLSSVLIGRYFELMRRPLSQIALGCVLSSGPTLVHVGA